MKDIIKNTDGQPDEEARSRCVLSIGALSLGAGGYATLLVCGNQPRKSPNLMVRSFKEATLCRHDCSSHWPLMMKSISSSSPLLGGQGVGLNVPML